MPHRPNLLAQIQATLDTLTPANLTAASAGYDLYEAYIWSLLIEAARSEGANVTFSDNAGNNPWQFYFRTSPSSIFSPAHPYCHANIEFQGCPALEAHIGIYISGRSQVEHECDVAVIYKTEADLCRNSRVHPRCSKTVLSVECKYYLNSNIGINLGRSFLGLVNDIYNGDRFFVANRDSVSVRKLFAKHNKGYELNVTPLQFHLEVRLRGMFEKVFLDFKSEHA